MCTALMEFLRISLKLMKKLHSLHCLANITPIFSADVQIIIVAYQSMDEQSFTIDYE